MQNIYTLMWLLLLGMLSTDVAVGKESSLLNTTTTAIPTNSAPTGTVQRSGTTLTPTELNLYIKSLEHIKDINCRNDLNATLRGIVAAEPWAVAMYDATVRSAVGLESGILHQFGHFDECLQQNQPTDKAFNSPPVRAKYCLTNVTVFDLMVQNVDTRKVQSQNKTLTTYWGTCVPASCSASDVATHLEALLQRPVTVSDAMCQLRENELVISNGMFAYAAVLGCFIVLALLSTSYHAYLIYRAKQGAAVTKVPPKRDILRVALLSFSIIENTKKLFQGSKDQLGLNCINGIKALAMLFILAGHGLSFIYGTPVYNVEFISTHIKDITFSFLSNSLLFVDFFLLLSGFLFCRILLIELGRRHGQVNALVLYVGRYIRLTPAYMAIIGFYMTWFPSIGSGPLWKQRIERERERCVDSWWLNILYVNNYIGTDKLCMFQSWYLSVDTQLFFLAPIFIYLLYKYRKYGLYLLAVLVLCTSIIPFVVTYKGELDPTLMVYPDEVSDLSSNVFYVTSYIKTHMRASAYVIGLLTGFLVHIMQEKGTKLPKLLVRLAWLISVFIGFASMFYICRFYAKPYSNLESTLYSGFHKLGWNLSVAWLVLATTTGHAVFLQRFLNCGFFVPISRLTYCAYLSNGIVELYHASSIRSPAYMSYISLVNEVLAHILDTFVLAFCLCLLFESPIHALERILLRAKSSKPEKPKLNEESRTPSTSEERV